MKKTLTYVISIALIFALSFIAYKAYGYAQDYDQQMKAEAQNHMIDHKIKKFASVAKKGASDMLKAPMDMFTKTLDVVTGKASPSTLAPSGFFGTKVAKSYIDYNPKVRTMTLYFAVGLVLLLLTYFISPKPLFIVTVLTASIIAWFVGVFTPIMTMEVWKQLPLFGHTTFIFQSRGIWSTMMHLWEHGHYVVAMLVILFSVLLPIVKTLSLYIGVAMKKSSSFIEMIGKWSMADVFVMSILLATMSLNTEDMTTAQIHAAIYFFAAYVVLSMIGSTVLDRLYGHHATQKGAQA